LSADYVLKQFVETKPDTSALKPSPTGKEGWAMATPTNAFTSPSLIPSTDISSNECHDIQARARREINGVLVHELVHALQYSGKDSCPGGLIEGIADWVRLQAGLAPPHWKEKPQNWKGKS